jgi:hypothetical protein
MGQPVMRNTAGELLGHELTHVNNIQSHVEHSSEAHRDPHGEELANQTQADVKEELKSSNDEDDITKEAAEEAVDEADRKGRESESNSSTDTEAED